MGSLIIVTGLMSAAKTNILGEASDILAQRQIAHAAIDVEMTRRCTATLGRSATITRPRGLTRFLLARAVAVDFPSSSHHDFGLLLESNNSLE